MRATRGWNHAKVVGVVLAVLSVAVMAAALRVSDDRLPFQVVTADLDQRVAIQGGALSAGDVRVGTQLTREGTVASETTGIFVVVAMRLAATGNRDITLGSAQLLTRDGFTYKTYDASLLKAVTGFRTENDVVFEVDPAHIDDLTLQVWESELVSGYQQRSRIHLGVTPGNAEEWRQAAKDHPVEPRRTALTEALT